MSSSSTSIPTSHAQKAGLAALAASAGRHLSILPEKLPDRQAVEVVRERIDWKYAPELELTDPGFDFSVLAEFRTRDRRRGRTSPARYAADPSDKCLLPA
jgi:hypothetical protein